MIGKRIRGEGKVPNKYMMIREHPGKDEGRTGRPFSGKTGREIERFLDGVRLPAIQDVYLTSYIKEWCGPDLDYVQADYDRDEPELRTEIQAVRPSVILALGRGVSRYFLGDVDMEEVHGIPWKLPEDAPARVLFASPDATVVVPIYNPAAGFRSPEISAQSTYDFTQLEAFLAGDLIPRILYDDPIPEPVYEEIVDEAVLDAVMLDATVISTDTEGYPDAPWSVQLATKAGHAYIIRCKNTPLVQRFADWINSDPTRYRFVFHNSLHDLAMFRVLGVDTRSLRFDDTMVSAYNLQLEPQGLKPLCARHCNMRMDHYDDIMGDAGFQLAQDWLLSCQENEDAEYEARCQRAFQDALTTPYTNKAGKVVSGRKLKVPPKLPKSDLHKSIERCLRSVNPRSLWGNQVIDRHVECEARYGPMWIATLDHVPLDRAVRYAGRDADGTHRLRPELAARLHANNLWPVYSADMATVPLIDRMQQVGIKPDLSHFVALSGDLAGEIQSILDRIRRRIAECAAHGAGVPGHHPADLFNPNSTSHVGELLYNHFQIAVLKRTPGGDPSTNDKILEALEKDTRLDRSVRDLIADIREYREVYKLKHTFVDRIPDFVHRWPHDGRIHATFRITRVVSGRLAASEPNLLAMPKHGKFAKRFRQGFVSGDGAVIASWDLSQIELRVLAHLSQDPVLLHAFRNDIDLHAALAERIFGVKPKDQDGSKHRLPAKAVNFGIPMGMTNIGLCIELRKNGVDVNEDDAQRWLNETMSLYKEVPTYQQGKIAEARRYGFVADLRGRRRYIGGIRSWDDGVRSEAERFAFATPIQSGAQSILKRAEAHIYTHILLPHWKRNEHVEPLLQIHDDIIFECDERLISEVHKEMVFAMTKVPADDLSVPIQTSGDCGKSWGDMHEIR